MMNAIGAMIMSFFGAVFAALTLYAAWGWWDARLMLPFVVFIVIGGAAWVVGRRAPAIPLSPRAAKVLMGSTAGEGIGIPLGITLVNNLGHGDWALPVIALVVGLHFLPIGWAVPQRFYTMLGLGLIALGLAGFLLPQPMGTLVAGFGGALADWGAALWVIRRLLARPALSQAG